MDKYICIAFSYSISDVLSMRDHIEQYNQGESHSVEGGGFSIRYLDGQADHHGCTKTTLAGASHWLAARLL